MYTTPERRAEINHDPDTVAKANADIVQRCSSIFKVLEACNSQVFVKTRKDRTGLESDVFLELGNFESTQYE